MLKLYTLWELERELSPEDFQHILTPEVALEKQHTVTIWTTGTTRHHQ